MINNDENVHRYFLMKYCLKGIVHVNTDVVKKRHELLRGFEVSIIGHKE